MEVDEIQTHVSKFQRVSSNGSTNNSSNPKKLAAADAGAAAARLCGWPSSRIVRVSRASGGKDRHSKVLTSKGLRDRRVRLSVSTAIQFYDLQDRLGYDQPSKAVEWLLKAAASSIDELPSLDPSFGYRKEAGNCTETKSPACSSTSETSKGSVLSLTRSENRVKARERAREMASKKKESDVVDEENSSFTDLLNGAVSRNQSMDYLFGRSLTASGMPEFQQQQQQQFSFVQESFAPVVTSSSVGGGTLQSNFPSSVLPHYHHFHGSTNLPFFIVPNDHFPPYDHHKEKGKN